MDENLKFMKSVGNCIDIAIGKKYDCGTKFKSDGANMKYSGKMFSS